MSIKDKDVDLTIDMKFGREIRHVSNRPDDIMDVVNNMKKIPWKNRPLQSGDFQASYKRRKGDTFSDDIGCTLRRTFNNGWFYAGDFKSYLLDEYLFECGIQEPSYSVLCPRCGKYHFNRNRYELCHACELRLKYEEVIRKLFPKPLNIQPLTYSGVFNYIPWKDSSRDMYTREFKHPQHVLDSLK